MPEKQAAAEHVDAQSLREQACAECSAARADLDTTILANQTPDKQQRETELLPWVKERLPECVPHELAAEACLQIETDEAAAGFPKFRVDQLKPAYLKEEVLVAMAEVNAANRNATTRGEIDDGVPAKVPAEAGVEAAGLVTEKKLSQRNAELLSENNAQKSAEQSEADNAVEKEAKADELERLQVEFDAMRSDGVGTMGALRQISIKAESPETKRHLNALLQRVILLQTALPEKADTVTRLLNTVGLNLSATTLSGSFAGFMEAAQTDESLTDIDHQTLHQIIQQGDMNLRTGTQVYETALATVPDPATGELVPISTPDNKAQIRPGVYAFTETGQNVILEINNGSLHHKADVTNLDGASIGVLTEIFSLAALAHDNGADGFIKHVYGVDLERLSDQSFDLLTLNALQRKLTHLMNTGHDGEIFNSSQQAKLLETQMRLVSPTGELVPWSDNPNGYAARVKELGLDNDAVLAAFGEYTRLNYQSGSITPDQVQAHLKHQFADFVVTGDYV